MPDSTSSANTAGASGQSGPERVRAAVVETARKMFADRGIHAVSVREIAKEVGVSHTLLHLYFGSKDEIVRQVLNSYDANVADEIRSAESIEMAIGDAFKKVVVQPDAKVLASALLEGIVPDRISRDAAVTRAIADRVGGSEFDARIIGMAIASMTLGWAVGSEWLKNSVDLSEMSDEELLDKMSALLEHWVRHCR